MIYLILNDIRSVHNVASIFRTADAAGVSKIYLTGYTPAPLDRFGRARRDFAKVSLGAENFVSWEAARSASRFLKRLKKEGVRLAAIEQDTRAVSYKKISARGKPLALLFGNEVRGLPKHLLSLCDAIAEIPMRGKKESLNVSVAVGIALFNCAPSALRHSGD